MAISSKPTSGPEQFSGCRYRPVLNECNRLFTSVYESMSVMLRISHVGSVTVSSGRVDLIPSGFQSGSVRDLLLAGR